MFSQLTVSLELKCAILQSSQRHHSFTHNTPQQQTSQHTAYNLSRSNGLDLPLPATKLMYKLPRLIHVMF